MAECIADGYARIVNRDELGKRERILTEKNQERIISAARRYFPGIGGPTPRRVFYKLVETMTRRYKDLVDAIRSAYSTLNAVERQKEFAIIRGENLVAAGEGRTLATIF